LDSTRPAIRFDRNELSGAFGDMGTDVPLIIGVALASHLDGASVLIMFGAMQILTGLAYLFYKLLYWDRFSVGIAPLVIGIFFFGSVQLISVGIIGEYIGSIHTHVQKRPLVIERERINFEFEPGLPFTAPATPAREMPKHG